MSIPFYAMAKKKYCYFALPPYHNVKEHTLPPDLKLKIGDQFFTFSEIERNRLRYSIFLGKVRLEYRAEDWIRVEPVDYEKLSCVSFEEINPLNIRPIDGVSTHFLYQYDDHVGPLLVEKDGEVSILIGPHSKRVDDLD